MRPLDMLPLKHISRRIVALVSRAKIAIAIEDEAKAEAKR